MAPSAELQSLIEFLSITVRTRDSSGNYDLLSYYDSPPVEEGAGAPLAGEQLFDDSPPFLGFYLE